MTAPIVIIGAGHNGLVASTRLAKAGRQIVVLESSQNVGGLGRGEVFAEGFSHTGLLHDATGLRAQVVRELKLESHGLNARKLPLKITLPAKDAPSIFMQGARVDGVDAQEQARFEALHGQLDRFRKPLMRILSEKALDPLGPYLPLLGPLSSIRRLGASDMTALMRIPPMAVADWMRDALGVERLRAGMAHRALIGEWLGPWSPWSAANLLLASVAEGPGFVGGPAAVTAALKSAATQAGVQIRTGCPVRRIRIAGQRVTGVELESGEVIMADMVASTCDPRNTFLKLIGPAQLTNRMAQDARTIRLRGVTAKMHLGIRGALKDSDGQIVQIMRTGETLDDLERAFDALKYGEISEKPILDIRVPSHEDPSLAPEGHHVVSIMVHFAPYDLRSGWGPDEKALLESRVMGVLSDACPGIQDQIVASELLTPVDIEARYGVSQGHIYHGEHAPDQLLFMRPTIQCAHFRTPIGGLYLCGSGSHPGGGITGMPGLLGAKTMLAEG